MGWGVCKTKVKMKRMLGRLEMRIRNNLGVATRAHDAGRAGKVTVHHAEAFFSNLSSQKLSQEARLQL